MSPIPHKLREELADDPEYAKCARRDEGECSGRITWEHALLYQGRQVQERFAIIPLCYFHHLGDGMNKRWNQDYALARATATDRKKYPLLKWS